MEDLYEMMEDPSVDAADCESDYDHLIGDDFVEEDGGISAQQFGIALGFAEMLSDQNDSLVNPSELFEDFETSLDRVSLKDRHKASAVPVPAFEAYVYNKCGI